MKLSEVGLTKRELGALRMYCYLREEADAKVALDSVDEHLPSMGDLLKARDKILKAFAKQANERSYPPPNTALIHP